jgi:hypothetical protein
MSADRYDDEARRLMCGTHPTDADVRVLAAALRAAERRGAERMQRRAEQECRAMRVVYDAKAAELDAQSQHGAYWQGKGQGADGCMHVVSMLDIDAVLAGETR